MARHRASRVSRWFRRLTATASAPATPEPADPAATGPLPAVPATADPAQRVVLEEVPAQPTSVRLDYPDGERLHAGWHYAGRHGSHEDYIVRVPDSATLVNGMVVRANRNVLLTVAVEDVPPMTRPRHLRDLR